eukprot:GHVO01010896.1.p1 GENE.GHVO01010896.1~~GHVO01010896.1.p1  ORF type:complete len:110 (+),score=16.27 GHVO01010896.1:28-357(+)
MSKRTAAKVDEGSPPKPEPEEGELTENDLNTFWPKMCFFINFIFPVAGCIMFCVAAYDSPRGSPRYQWSRRALNVGSLLSFVYMLGIACIVSEVLMDEIPSGGRRGVGF